MMRTRLSRSLHQYLPLAFLLSFFVTQSWAEDRAVEQQAASVISAANFNLNNYRGQVIYLDFWASWCGPCNQSFPWMETLQQEFGARGFKVIAVNVDEDAEAFEAFMQQHRPSFTVVTDPDGQLASHYQLIGMPSSFIIGRDGQVKYQHKGFIQADTHRLQDKIENQLRAGEKQQHARTDKTSF